MGGSSSKEFSAHPESTTMKAVVLPTYGRENLVLQDVPKPTITKDSDVLIKVKAASLNPIDKIRVDGGLKMVTPETYATPVIGYDASGIIESVGKDVTKFKEGDEVYVRLRRFDGQGSLAEYVLAKEAMVALKPKNISFEEAASLPLVSVTAMQAFRRGGVKEGDKVVISGGAGGVGTIAIQLAKNVFKCSHVLTTGSAGAKTDFCKELGADAVADYKSQEFWDGSFGNDFDFGFDLTNESAKMCLIAKENAHVVSIAGTPTVEEMTRIGTNPNFIVKTFLYLGRNKEGIKNAADNNVNLSYMFLQPNGEDLDTLRGYVEDGLVKPIIDSTHPLAEFNKAFDVLYSGRAKGKVVLTI